MNRPKTWLAGGGNGVKRCWWAANDPLYQRYHDEEWGRPTEHDRYLFEKICLEGFQSGLSWITILRKRENFRSAFRGFEIERVARMTRGNVARLLENEGIVRHRGKIESTINNAQRAIDMIEECGSLAAFVWSFASGVNGRSATRMRDRPKRGGDMQPTTPESVALSKALRQRGWTFVGPTTMHAFMQAVGMVNDHIAGCTAGDEAERQRRGFRPPSLA